MNDLFGQQLRCAREHHGISIEEAAHATRMRPVMIEALEAGDLSTFPSPTYARSFLLLYGKYLRLDMKAVAAEIDTGLQVTVENYQYLTHANETTPGPARRGDFARPHRLPAWTPVLALGGMTALVVFGLMLWLNMSRIGDVAVTPAPKPDDERKAIEPVVLGAHPEKVSAAVPTKRLVLPPASEPVVASEPTVQNPSPPRVIAPAHLPAAVPANASSSQAPSPVYPKDPPPPPSPSRRQAISQLDGIEVRTARVISPVARLASNDAALLAQADSAPQTPPPLIGLAPIEEADPADDEGATSPLTRDPNTIEIEPLKKTWLVIRDATGTTTLFEDYLYPSARPLRLPAGKYVIEARETDAVEIRRAGRTIAYTAGGLKLE